MFLSQINYTAVYQVGYSCAVELFSVDKLLDSYFPSHDINSIISVATNSGLQSVALILFNFKKYGSKEFSPWWVILWIYIQMMLVKLNGPNYLQWAKCLKVFVTTKGRLKYLVLVNFLNGASPTLDRETTSGWPSRRWSLWTTRFGSRLSSKLK